MAVSGPVLRSLKDFCMTKSANDLDVSIVLSKCWFIGVAPFESTYIVGHTEIRFFICICLKISEILLFQSTLDAKHNTLYKSCTFKDKCVVNAEIFILKQLANLHLAEREPLRSQPTYTSPLPPHTWVRGWSN